MSEAEGRSPGTSSPRSVTASQGMLTRLPARADGGVDVCALSRTIERSATERDGARLHVTAGTRVVDNIRDAHRPPTSTDGVVVELSDEHLRGSLSAPPDPPRLTPSYSSPTLLAPQVSTRSPARREASFAAVVDDQP